MFRIERIREYFPIAETLRRYHLGWLKGDLSAGLTVGVMLIPQGMAYAMIAGLPPIYGLYASTLPIIIYAILGTSRQLAVGPVAMVSLLTAAGIGMLAEAGSEQYILMALTLAFSVGLIQFLLGVFRLGFLVNFLSHPVISGFTSAAALIIGISQLKHLLGMDIPRSHFVHETIFYAITHISLTNLATLLLGLGGIIIIMAAKKLHKAIPGALIAVVFGILATWGFGLNAGGVSIVGAIPAGLPSPSMPSFSMQTIMTILPVALAISLVSFMESIAVAKAIQAKHKDYEIRPNQELIALGMANIAGSFLQSYPVTGGFSRTAVNDQAGAKTTVASVISVILILLTLLFFTPLFYFLPNAILASVIMVAVFGLIDFKEAIHLWHADRTDFWMLLVTFISTLVLGIEQGIGIGVVLSLSIMIFRTTRPHIAVLGKVPDTPFYRNKDRFDNVICRDDLLIIRFDAPLYFANVAFFKETLGQLVQEKGDRLKFIIINADSVNNVDSTAIRALKEIVDDYRNHNIQIHFTGVIGPVRDSMQKSHLMDKIGSHHFFMSIPDAVSVIDGSQPGEETDPPYQDYTLQTNE